MIVMAMLLPNTARGLSQWVLASDGLQTSKIAVTYIFTNFKWGKLTIVPDLTHRHRGIQIGQIYKWTVIKYKIQLTNAVSWRTVITLHVVIRCRFLTWKRQKHSFWTKLLCRVNKMCCSETERHTHKSQCAIIQQYNCSKVWASWRIDWISGWGAYTSGPSMCPITNIIQVIKSKR